MKEETSKTSWDMRQGFSIAITNYLNDLRMVQLHSDYSSWYRLLRAMNSMVRPYISESDRNEIKKQLDLTYTNLTNSNKFSSSVLTEAEKNFKAIATNKLYFLLIDTTDLLCMAAKDLLLPGKGDEETEFDQDSFFRGSSE